jgi:hypothetical protein
MGKWVEEAKEPALSLQLIEMEELSWCACIFLTPLPFYPFTHLSPVKGL